MSPSTDLVGARAGLSFAVLLPQRNLVRISPPLEARSPMAGEPLEGPRLAG